jgi:short-subunit dehydrogenase
MNPLAVITGGTKGIGRATAERFLAEGFDVVTCARQSSDLESFSETAKVDFPAVKLVNYVDSLTRPVTVLVNNTGVFIPGQLHSEPEGILERSIETNVYSAYHLTRGLLPKMVAERRGHIFNICSTASLMAYPNGGSYAISKFALYGMTKGFREELKPFGIKVTAVLPGPTLTASWAGTDLPESRFMKAEDVAASIWSAFNLSPTTVIEEILMRPVEGDIG